jgi:RNA polymerase sigma factor (sigma-70 family)
MIRPASFHRPADLVITNLIVRLAQGDRSVFAPLFKLIWPVILQYCSRALREKQDAEDAAQETVLRVFNRIAEFDCTRDGLAWVLGIAFYEVRTLRRRHFRSREIGSEHLEWARADAQGPDEQIIREELRVTLQDAIEGLRDTDRAIVQELLKDDDRKDGPAEPAVRKRKQRAIERLITSWRRLLDES